MLLELDKTMSEQLPQTVPAPSPEDSGTVIDITNIEDQAQNDENERRHDLLVTDDKEILGNSTHLRMAVHETSKSITDGLRSKIVEGRNALATPTTKILEYRRDKKQKQAELYELKHPEGTRTKAQEKRLQMLKKRAEVLSGWAKQRHSRHTSRIEKLGKAKSDRQEKYQKQVDGYVHRKILSMQRKQLRERSGHKISKYEHVRYFNNLSEENKKRIVRDAIAAVRQENIRKGTLAEEYEVDETATIRKIGEHYARATQ